MNQTLSLTTLGERADGDRGQPRARRCAPAIRSAATSSRGTSTASARSRAVREDGFARRLRIALPDGCERYVVEHGSVTVDGVSLTVAGARPRTGSRSR